MVLWDALLLQVYKKRGTLRDWQTGAEVAANHKSKPLRQGASPFTDLLKGTCKLSFTAARTPLPRLQFCLSDPNVQ